MQESVDMNSSYWTSREDSQAVMKHNKMNHTHFGDLTSSEFSEASAD